MLHEVRVKHRHKVLYGFVIPADTLENTVMLAFHVVHFINKDKRVFTVDQSHYADENALEDASDRLQLIYFRNRFKDFIEADSITHDRLFLDDGLDGGFDQQNELVKLVVLSQYPCMSSALIVSSGGAISL